MHTNEMTVTVCVYFIVVRKVVNNIERCITWYQSTARTNTNEFKSLPPCIISAWLDAESTPNRLNKKHPPNVLIIAAEIIRTQLVAVVFVFLTPSLRRVFPVQLLLDVFRLVREIAWTRSHQCSFLKKQKHLRWRLCLFGRDGEGVIYANK